MCLNSKLKAYAKTLKIISHRDYIMTILTKCQRNIFQTLSTVLYVHIWSVKYLTFSLDSPYVPIHLKEFSIEYRIIIWHRKCSSNIYILIFLHTKFVLLFYNCWRINVLLPNGLKFRVLTCYIMFIF